VSLSVYRGSHRYTHMAALTQVLVQAA
jgi:hypothetical protein